MIAQKKTESEAGGKRRVKWFARGEVGFSIPSHRGGVRPWNSPIVNRTWRKWRDPDWVGR